MQKITIYAGTGKDDIGQLSRIEVNGILVLTTVQLAQFYEVSEGRLLDNFGDNKSQFIEGKHYFKLTGEDLKNFKRQTEGFGVPLVAKFAPHLILWTNRGVARHAKMLNTRTAWDVFELLEDNYFNPPKKSASNEFTDKEKVRFLLQAAKITKDATRRENLLALAEKIIVG